MFDLAEKGMSVWLLKQREGFMLGLLKQGEGGVCARGAL